MEVPEHKQEVIIRGVAASPGVAHGFPFIYIIQELEVPRKTLDPNAHEAEVERFEQALLETRRQISDIRSQVTLKLGEEEARIFDAHMLVLEDVALIEETIREQKKTNLNIESCFESVSQRYIEAFNMMDDDYIKERLTDIKDVSRRVLNVMLGKSLLNLSELNEHRIIVAEDLPPSDSAMMDKEKVLGIMTDSGSRTSHAVIMARSLQVPAVVGLHDVSKKVKQDDYVLVDGYEGVIIINPSERTLFTYGEYHQERQNIQKVFESFIDKPAETLDGYPVRLFANIGGYDDIPAVARSTAQGIGLFRTESIFLGRDSYPSEEEQYQVYSEVVKAMNSALVTIRTLDLGGDKRLTSQRYTQREENPFMGFRAIRFCLEYKDIFKEQLRAILRAGAHGNVNLMYPMITSLDELIQANMLLDEAREELKARGVAYDAEMKAGIMIETPSAVLIADDLAKHAAFFSIGTNDLIQYTLVVDRVNDLIAHLYDPCHPAVLRSIQSVADAARSNDIPIGVCGEMASDPLYLPLLVGLGAHELSLTPMALPEIKYFLRQVKQSDLTGLADEVMRQTNPKDILEILKQFYAKYMSNVTEAV